jgi:hypothetical protein
MSVTRFRRVSWQGPCFGDGHVSRLTGLTSFPRCILHANATRPSSWRLSLVYGREEICLVVWGGGLRFRLFSFGVAICALLSAIDNPVFLFPRYKYCPASGFLSLFHPNGSSLSPRIVHSFPPLFRSFCRSCKSRGRPSTLAGYLLVLGVSRSRPTSMIGHFVLPRYFDCIEIEPLAQHFRGL